jgi:hypothetical protein
MIEPNPPAESAPAPKSFGDLALTAATQLYLDIHVNLSGLVFFFVLAYGIVHPELKDQCQVIAGLAGTYLFASAKRK